MANMYATVGKWDVKPGDKGFSVFKYDETNGGLEFIETSFPQTTPGSQCYYPEKGIVYICDEREDLEGQVGGGGYVYAFKIDPETGKLSLINRVQSMSVAPSYIWMDKSRKYLLVTHHTKPNKATKVVKNADGSFSTQVVYDDAALVLFRVNEDGSIGDVADVHITPGAVANGKRLPSYQHSVTCDPSGKLYFVCDKGCHKVYTYHVDIENGKLVFLKEYDVDPGTAPRYSVFHPTKPLLFQNLEFKCDVIAWKYDTASGELEKVCVEPLFTDEELASFDGTGIKANGACMFGPSDIVLSPDAKQLYVSVRKCNKLVVMDVAEDGSLKTRQVIDSQGENPRGFCLAPDGKFLFCINMVSGNIARFAISEEGLSFDGYAAENLHIPANMGIISL